MNFRTLLRHSQTLWIMSREAACRGIPDLSQCDVHRQSRSCLLEPAGARARPAVKPALQGGGGTAVTGQRHQTQERGTNWPTESQRKNPAGCSAVGIADAPMS